jgi:hypothetical protein
MREFHSLLNRGFVMLRDLSCSTAAPRAAIAVACLALSPAVAAGQGVVTDAVLTADPAYLQAHICPVTVTFNGSITMNGPGTVTYRFVRSDGATSAPYSVSFAKPGTSPVSTTWTLGEATVLPNYEGWVAIQVLTPNAVESAHADATFRMACGAAPPPQQPGRGYFRVSITGFVCGRETRDNVLELDGPGDEIFLAPHVVIVDRSGATSEFSSFAHGPVFGGIRTGTRFPTSTPEVLSSTPVGLGFPGVLFEGELVEGQTAVAITPTLWEWDRPSPQLDTFFGLSSAADTGIASVVVRAMTGPMPARLGGLGTALDGLINVPIAPEGDGNRPIGITVTGGAGSFRPQFLLLTYEGAASAASGASFGGDTFAIRYVDPTSHEGDYTLFVKVERFP